MLVPRTQVASPLELAVLEAELVLELDAELVAALELALVLLELVLLELVLLELVLLLEVEAPPWPELELELEAVLDEAPPAPLEVALAVEPEVVLPPVELEDTLDPPAPDELALLLVLGPVELAACVALEVLLALVPGTSL